MSNRVVRLDDGREIEYVLDCKKRKNMYITIRDGIVVLKISPLVSVAQGEDFIRQKANWILKNLAKKKTEHTPQSFNDGDVFSLAGRDYTVEHQLSDKHFQPYFTNDILTISVRADSDETYLFTQANKALSVKITQIIEEGFDRLTALTELYPNKVTLKNLTGSWGRCSSEGAISINVKIAFYEQKCIDYVIIHELCHLKHMNHSKEFWALVEQYCPDWKVIRNSLKS